MGVQVKEDITFGPYFFRHYAIKHRTVQVTDLPANWQWSSVKHMWAEEFRTEVDTWFRDRARERARAQDERNRAEHQAAVAARAGRGRGRVRGGQGRGGGGRA